MGSPSAPISEGHTSFLLADSGVLYGGPSPLTPTKSAAGEPASGQDGDDESGVDLFPRDGDLLFLTVRRGSHSHVCAAYKSYNIPGALEVAVAPREGWRIRTPSIRLARGLIPPRRGSLHKVP